MMNWMKTARDRGSEASHLRSRALRIRSTDEEREMVRCPCGREVPDDALVDLRGVPGTVVRGEDVEWACDACWARLCRDESNDWTPGRLARALGAPDEVWHELRAKELVRDRGRRAKGFNPVEEYERALADIRRA